MQDFLIIGGQEPMETRLNDNSNVFQGIPPYFTPYGRDFIKISGRAYSFPAYAVPVLAACLKKRRISVSCINDFYQNDEESIARKVRNTKRAVGISTTFLTKESSITKIIDFVKKTNPHVKVILGGAGIINFPGVRKHADINVFYEGEETIQELTYVFEKRRNIEDVKGISYFKRGREIVNKRRDCIGDLGKIPIPAWNAVSDKPAEERYLPLESSRGCVGNCSFCLETKYWPGIRFYPVDRVVREIKAGIKKYGTRFYYFQDSNISNSRNYLKRLCDAILESNLCIKWSCESRVDGLDRALVDKMYRAGCRGITFGMESADRRVLQNMNKAMSEDKPGLFSSTVRHMRKRNMLANINIIVGFPGEDKKSIKNTVDFLLEAKPFTYSMAKFFLEKGTDIWKNRKKFNLSGSMYDWRHNTMCSGELDAIVREIFLRVSAKQEIYHWTSAAVDLVRALSKGKTFGNFIKYLKSINQICVEDLTKTHESYSSRYNDSFRYVTRYIQRT
ncbi:MAG: radical SAM protein [Candidatus Omnitrophica bacterium]|nr:radical SAM protein [Candidatus Omnitrophota bacterium]